MSANTFLNKNKLYIIADFDYTLTTKDSQNCWTVLSTIPNISKEYIKESRQNDKYYLPIEQNNSINFKEKKSLMKQWYENHIHMLIKYHLKEKDIQKISKSKSIILRNGAAEFLKFTNKNKIPVIILSAGISTIIENVLKNNDCFYDNIYIISNIFKFKDGILKSLRNNIIHSLNKNQVEIPSKIKDVLKDKDELLLLGDNIGDTLMTLKENTKVLKIGFLNYNDKLCDFKKYFDIIYSQDDSFSKIIDLIK